MKNNSGRLVFLVALFTLLGGTLFAQVTSKDYTWFNNRTTKMVSYSDKFDPGPLSAESIYPKGSMNQGITFLKSYKPTYIRCYGEQGEVELGFKIMLSDGTGYRSLKDMTVMFHYSYDNGVDDGKMFFTQVDESFGLNSDDFYVVTDNSWLASYDDVSAAGAKVTQVPVKDKKTGNWIMTPIGDAYTILEFTPKYYIESGNNLINEALRLKHVEEKDKIQKNLEKVTGVTVWPFVMKSLAVQGQDMYKKSFAGFAGNPEGQRYYYFFRDTDGVYGVIDTYLAAAKDPYIVNAEGN